MNRTAIVGLVGSGIVALCCFTPVLVVVLTAIGLGASIAWLDLVLFPLLAVFVVVALYGLWTARRVRR